MCLTFLGRPAIHNHVNFFFQQHNFGHFKKFMYAPKRKSGFHFFAHLKKTEQSNYTMFWKISNLILNRFQIPSEPDPPTVTSQDWGRGEGFSKRGRGDHFETPLFRVYFFPDVSKKIFPIIMQLTLSCQWVQTPLDHPLSNFVISEHSLILALKQAKLHCQYFIKQTLLWYWTTIHVWEFTTIFIQTYQQNILDKLSFQYFSSIINISSPSKIF